MASNVYDDEEGADGLAAYQSSLNDLNMNSKPMINVLTMLAEENEANAKGIVTMIKTRIISKEDIKFKMPSLYLLDSILKNVGGDYIKIISQHMIEIFTNVFAKGDEKVRMSMFKLRNTWPQYFPSKFLYELDMSVRILDPNWPVAEAPVSASSIHINPKFLLKRDEGKPATLDDSVVAENLRAREQEEKLKAEEKRIKEELRKLRENQEQLQRARIEEEKAKRERMIRQQQIEREKLIEEQQRQIRALKQLQGDLVTASSSAGSPKKQEISISPRKIQKSNSGRAVDPRLARHLKITDRQFETVTVDSVSQSKPSSIASNPIVAYKHLEKSPQKPLQFKPLASRTTDSSATASSVLTVPLTLPSTSQTPPAEVFATAQKMPPLTSKMPDSTPKVPASTPDLPAPALAPKIPVAIQKILPSTAKIPAPTQKIVVTAPIISQATRSLFAVAASSQQHVQQQQQTTTSSSLAASSQQSTASQERLETSKNPLQPPDTASKTLQNSEIQSQPKASDASSQAAVPVKLEESASTRSGHNKDNVLKRGASPNPDLRTEEGEADGHHSKSKGTIDEPPAKKKKAEKLVKESIRTYDIAKRVTEQYSEEPRLEEVSEAKTIETEKMDVDEKQQSEVQESPQRVKFKRVSHSEWRKQMIEKAKIERKQMIPKETELPRQMRMDNHEALLAELGKRLDSGEITKDAHDALVKQVNLMYEVQRSRDSIGERRKINEERKAKPSAPHRKSRSPEARTKPYERSGDSARLLERKAQRQKETNEDLIRQLRKKRLDAEKEQLRDEERQEKYKSRIDTKKDEYRFIRRGRDDRYRILERRDDPRKRDRESANRNSRREPMKDREHATKNRPQDSRERQSGTSVDSKDGKSDRPTGSKERESGASADYRERPIDRSAAAKERQRDRSNSKEKQGSQPTDSKERGNDGSADYRERPVDRSVVTERHRDRSDSKEKQCSRPTDSKERHSDDSADYRERPIDRSVVTERERDRSDSKEKQCGRPRDSKERHSDDSADSRERPIDRSVAGKERQRDRSDSKEKQGSRPMDSNERHSDGSADSRERPIDGSVVVTERQRDRLDSREKQGSRPTDSNERHSDGSADSRERIIDRSAAAKERRRDRSDSKEKQGNRPKDSKERHSDGFADSRERPIERSVAAKERQRDRPDSMEKQGSRSADSKERTSDWSAESREGGRSVDPRERHRDRRRNPALGRVIDKKRSSKEKSPASDNHRQRGRDSRRDQRQRPKENSPANRKFETSKETAQESKEEVQKGESRLRRDNFGRTAITEGKVGETRAVDAGIEDKPLTTEDSIANAATKSKEHSSENEPSNEKASNQEGGTAELPRFLSKVGKNHRKVTQKEAVADKGSNLTDKSPKKGVLRKNNDEKSEVLSSESKTGAGQREPMEPSKEQSIVANSRNQPSKGRSEILPGFRIPRKDPSKEDKEKPVSTSDPDSEVRSLSWRHAEGLPFPGAVLRARAPGPNQRGFRPRLGPPSARMLRGPHPPRHRMPPPRFHGEFRDGTPPTEGVRHDPEEGSEEPRGPPTNHRPDGWRRGGPMPRQIGPRFRHGPRPPFRHYEEQQFAEDQGSFNEKEFHIDGDQEFYDEQEFRNDGDPEFCHEEEFRNDGDQEFYDEEEQYFEEGNEYYVEGQFHENDKPIHDHPMPYFDEESEHTPDYNEGEIQHSSEEPPPVGPPHGPPRFRGPFRHPEERRPRLRHPEEVGSRFRHPEDMGRRFRNPDENGQRFRNPEELRPRFRHPEETGQRYRHPGDPGPRFRNPDERGPRFRTPDEVGPRFRHTGEMEPRFRHPAWRGPRFRGPIMNEPRFGPPDEGHRNFERYDLEQLEFQEPPFMEEENMDREPPNREPPIREPPHMEPHPMEHRGYYRDRQVFHHPDEEGPFLHENRKGFPGRDEHSRERFEQNMHPPQFDESRQEFDQEFRRQRPYFPPEEDFHAGPHEFRQHDDFVRPPPNREFDIGPPRRQGPPFNEQMRAFPSEDHGHIQEFMARPPHDFSNPGHDMYQNIEERRLSPRPYEPGFYPAEGQSNVEPVLSSQKQHQERPIWMSGPQEHLQGKPVTKVSNPIAVNPIMQMIQNIRQNAEPAQGPIDNNTAPASKQSSFIGVRELFQKLVSTGVIDSSGSNATVEKSSTPPPTLATEEESIPEVGFVIEDLKRRHSGVVNVLYSGTKCASCGLRFRQEDKRYYRDHLDWHFRNNRKEKESKRSVSRSWFYFIENDGDEDAEHFSLQYDHPYDAYWRDLLNTIQFNFATQWLDMDDVTDLEEQSKSSVFESEAKAQEPVRQDVEESCAVLGGDQDSVCKICYDPFEQFWDEALEEWRYKDARRVNGKTYHINCYSDVESGDIPSSSDEEMQCDEDQFDPLGSSPSNLDRTYTMFDTDSPLIRQDDFDSDPHFKSELKIKENTEISQFPAAISQLFNLSNVKQEAMDTETTPEQGLPFLQTIKEEHVENPADYVVKSEPKNLEIPGTDDVDAAMRTEEFRGNKAAEAGNEGTFVSDNEHMPVTVKLEPGQSESEGVGHRKIDGSENMIDEALKDTVLTQESTDKFSRNEQLEKRPDDVQTNFDSSSKLAVQVRSGKTVDNSTSKLSGEVENGSYAVSTVSAAVQMESDASPKVCNEIQTSPGASSTMPSDDKVASSDSVSKSVLIRSDPSGNVLEADKIVADESSNSSEEVQIKSIPDVTEECETVAVSTSNLSHDFQIGSDASSKSAENAQTDSSCKVVEENLIVDVVSSKLPKEDATGSGASSKVSTGVETAPDASSRLQEGVQIDFRSRVTEEGGKVDVLSSKLPEEDKNDFSAVSKVAEDEQSFAVSTSKVSDSVDIAPDSSYSVSGKDSESASSSQNPVMSNESLSKKVDENCQCDALYMSAINSDDIGNDGNPQS